MANETTNQPPFLEDYEGVRGYIGARYVPVMANPIEWSDTQGYEPLTIVIHEGNSYTSTQTVPPGIDINNTEFWALTGNYNAQIEQYRKEVHDLQVSVDGWQDQLDSATSDISGLTTKIGNAEINITSLQNLTMLQGKTAIFLGDSLTYGQDNSSTTGQVAKPWPTVFGELTGCSVTNIAVGGATAAEYSGAPSTAYQQANSVTQEYDIAFLMFGTNDYGYDGTISPDSSYQGIKDAINNLLTKFPNMMIIGVIPPYMPGDTVVNASGRTALLYKNFIRQSFVNKGCPTIDFTNGLTWNATNWDEKLMSWDKNLTRLHPNQEAYIEMGTMAATSWRVNGSGTWANPYYNRAGYIPTLENGANYVNNGEPAICWRDQFGNMFVDFGYGINPNSQGHMFTLPENLRPYRDFYIPAVNVKKIGTVNATMMIVIHPSGLVETIGNLEGNDNQMMTSGVIGSIWFLKPVEQDI